MTDSPVHSTSCHDNERRYWPVSRWYRSGVSALLAVLLGVAAGEAQADGFQCPQSSVLPGLAFWQLDTQANGVFMCRGKNSNGQYMGVTVQVVDFRLGAKMRVMSEVSAGSPMGQPDTQFVKRTVQDWYTWTQQGNVTVPPTQRLFSVTNASLFTWALPGTTSMSFPQKKWNTVTSTGKETRCHEIGEDSGKRFFALSDPQGAGRQYARINVFNDGCQADINSVNAQLGGFFDATVAYHPIYGNETTTDNRTFVGTMNQYGYWNQPQDVAYVLTSSAYLTVVQARDILVQDFGAMWTMQLDGGGSTGYYHANFSDRPNARSVPEVLVIYSAP